MKKIIFKIVLLVILSAAVFTEYGSLQAQTFATSKYDSVTANSRWTWVKLPVGISTIRVKCDSASYVSVAFTGAGKRTEQRKDSLNINATIYKGGTGYFYSRDNDSIGFKGTGKIYYWVDRGQGISTEVRGGVKSGVDSVYLVNTKDTLTYIDTLTINDTIRIRDASGYKYAELLCKINSTDSVIVERYETRLGLWIPVGVYDQYTDTKYQLISPLAAVNRSYLINSPNVGKYRLRRLNLATASLSNKFIVISKWVRF